MLLKVVLRSCTQMTLLSGISWDARVNTTKDKNARVGHLVTACFGISTST